MAKKMTIKVLQDAVRSLSGDTSAISPSQTTRLKSGHRVWRLQGTPPWMVGSMQRDGQDVLLCEAEGMYQRITSFDDLQRHTAKLGWHAHRWEYWILTDSDRAKRQLKEQIERDCGQPVEVLIGAGAGFPTSISVRTSTPEPQPAASLSKLRSLQRRIERLEGRLEWHASALRIEAVDQALRLIQTALAEQQAFAARISTLEQQLKVIQELLTAENLTRFIQDVERLHTKFQGLEQSATMARAQFQSWLAQIDQQLREGR